MKRQHPSSPTISDGREEWRHFKPGDEVEVAEEISEGERGQAGRKFRFVKYSAVHRYAVVADAAGLLRYFMPEALRKVVRDGSA